MKRFFALVLCWTMLLSQMAMVADAAKAKELSDLLYLEENGIVVEDGGTIDWETPLGRPDTGGMYSPYVPKLMPEALKNLGLLPKGEEESGVAKSEGEKSGETLEIKTMTGKFNKESVMLFAGAGESFESILFHDALDMEIEMLPSPSIVWYSLYSKIPGVDAKYLYVRAEDVTLLDEFNYDGAYATTEDNTTVYVREAPEGSVVEIEPLPAEKAPPLRTVRGKNHGQRELIYACDITIRNPDGSEWQPEDGEVGIAITLPEIPELGEVSRFYVEHVDSEGNVEFLKATPCFDTNMLIVKSSGFSSFYFYTVDFTVNGVWHSIPGGTSIYLSALLGALALDYSVEDVASVSFTDPELIEVLACVNEETGEEDWKLTSLQAFLTEELLTVTLKSGEQREIFVYDAVTEKQWHWWNSSAGEYSYQRTLATGSTLEGYFTLEAYGDKKQDTSLAISGNSAGDDPAIAYAKFNIVIPSGVNFWLVSTDSNDPVVLRRHNTADYLAYPLFRVYSGGKLIIQGANKTASEYFQIDGCNRDAGDTIIRADGGVTAVEYVNIRRAKRTDGGGAAIITTADTGKNATVHISHSIIDNCDTTKADQHGGAIYLNNNNGGGSFRMYNVTVKNCDATGSGGAIFASGSCTQQTRLFSVTFSNNTAGVSGGAIYCDKSANVTQELAICGCTFDSNTAASNGGAVFVRNNDAFSLNRYQGTQSIYHPDPESTDPLDYSAMDFTASATTTFKSNKVTGTSGNNGGGLYIYDCSLDNTDIGGTTNFTGNSACHGGGMLLRNSTVQFDATLSFTSGNSASNAGGGIFLWNGSKLYGTGTLTVNGNKATGSGCGGGIALYHTSAACTFGPIGTLKVENNTAGGDGGGIYVPQGTLSLNGGSVSSNTSGGNGGGIYVNGGSLTATGKLNVDYNTANSHYGGGIYVANTTTFSITGSGSTISNNTTLTQGGGLYGTKAKVTLSNCTVSSNKSNNGHAGGIILLGDSANVATYTTTFTNCHITNNQCLNSNNDITGDDDRGAGIYAQHLGLTVSGGSIKGNSTPYGKGGGIYFDTSGGTLSITNGCEISGNSASRGSSTVSTGHGGGIYMSAGTLSISGSTIKGNSASHNGGGIFTSVGAKLDNVNVGVSGAGNTAGGNGGGIFMNGGTLAVTGTKTNTNISYNTATNHGGGLFMTTGSITLNLPTDGSTRYDLIFNGNKGKYGGGMFFGETGGTINITSTAGRLFAKNNNSESGGGAFISRCTVTSSAEFKLEANTASNYGGGMYIRSDTTHPLKLTLSVTPYIYQNTASQHGGGIYYESGTLDFQKGAVLHDNTAAKNGGGICAGSSLTLSSSWKVGYLDGTTWKGNFAQWGGGIYAGAITLTLGGATVQCNRATSHGGGIYANGTTIAEANFDKVKYNEAGTNKDGTVSSTGGNGGGIFLTGTSTMTMNGGTLSNNKAQAKAAESGGAFGGGICVDENATLNLKSGSISNNTAYVSGNYSQCALGGGVHTRGKLNITGNFTISGNTTSRYGGGLYQAVGASVTTINSGVTLTINGTNKADMYGGGIVVNNGTLTNNGTLIVQNNQAVSGGGGICMDYSGTINGAGALQISNNKATGTSGDGGGLYISGASANFAPTGAVGIYENHAEVYGGGVYLSAGNFKPATLSGSNFNIRDNTSDSDGGGLYYIGGTFAPTGTTQFYSNTASGLGGGIYTTATWTLTQNVKVGLSATQYNTAKDGGGIYVNGGTLSITGTTTANVVVRDNKATQNGGGIYVNSGTAQVTAGRLWVQANTATNNGGGVYVNGGTLKTTGTSAITITIGNTATGNGGGIYQAGGTISLAGTDGDSYLGGYRENAGNSAKNGGGAYLAGGTCTISSSIRVAANTASERGAGFYINGGSLTYNGSSMTIGFYKYQNVDTATNHATIDGGGIYVTGSASAVSLKNTTIDGNRAKWGGGIYMLDGNVTLDACSVKNHTVQVDGSTPIVNGGGVRIGGGTLLLKGASRIEGNKCSDSGAGIRLVAGNVTLQASSTIYNNTATTYGGGVYMDAGTLLLDNSSVNSNVSGNNACGICMNGSKAMTLTMQNGASVTNNTANNSAGSTGAGGLWVNQNSTVYLKGNTTISGNKTKNGAAGGIHLTGGKIEVTGENNVIKANTATTNGGGINIVGGSITIASGAALTVGGTAAADKNTAANGGGIYHATGTLTNAGTLNVSFNTATSNGGGIYIVSGTMNINAGTVNVGSNTAVNGGGICFNDGTVSVASTLNVYSNTASTNGGGMHMSNKGTIDGEGAINVYSNKAVDGAGMYLTGSSFSFAPTGNVQIYSNTASGNGGGIYSSITWKVTSKMKVGCTVNSSNLGNTANHGGGIYVNGGTLTINNASVKFNVAKNNGGGIHINTGTVVAEVAANVQNNTAIWGGGIHLHGEEAVLKWLSGAYWTVSNNTATNKGGGVYVYNGTITCESGSQLNIHSNTANYGGGMYFGGSTDQGATDNTVKTIALGGSGSGGLDIYWNTANINGGGIMMENCSVDFSTPAAITNNSVNRSNGKETDGNGGGMFINGWINRVTCTFKKNITLYGNTAVNNGGGIWINAADVELASGVTANIKKGRYGNDTENRTNAGNSAVNGGGIYLADGTFTNNGTLNVNENTASTHGGGIYVGVGSFTSTSKLCANSNTASSHGGGIYANGSTKFSITGSNNTINSNTATAHGGAVCAYYCDVEIASCTIDNNTATNGHAGGVFLKGAADPVYTLKLTSCTITNNDCTNGNGKGVNGNTENSYDDDRGAGVYAESVNLTISGGSVSTNKTVYGRGGGIYFSGSNAALSITNCTISGNEAHNTNETLAGKAGHGGGICIDAAMSASISGATITGNKADANGGGIYTKVAATISNSTIGASGGANTAGTNGGGIYCDQNVAITLSGTTSVGYNTATSGAGGGVYKSSGTLALQNTAALQNNTAGTTGGGLYMSGATVTFANTISVHSNTAGTYGGGIYMNSGTFTNNGTLTVYSNKATKNSGGGIFFNSGTVKAGTLNVYSNSATSGNGGGIYTKIALSLTGATIGGDATAKGNKAANGGGIFAEQNLTLSGSTVRFNQATNGNGGGIYSVTGKTVTLSGTSYVNNNTASNQGGGVFLAGTANLICNGTVQINSNTATNNGGGGVYLNSGKATFGGDATATTVVNQINSNKAKNGGGIFVNGGQMVCTASTQIHSNEATAGNGGGIYLHGAGTCAINGPSCTIKTNTATKNGAGVYIDTTGSFTTSQTVNMDSNKATGDGGALYVNEGGTATFGSKLGAQNNQAANGGAIYNKNGTVTFGTNASICNNTASNNGGAIYNNKTFNVNGGSLWLGSWSAESSNRGNKAVNGAGIYQAAGTFKMAASSMQMGDNRATGNGGGIYMAGGEMNFSNGVHHIGALLYTWPDTDVDVAGNKAQNGAGIYMGGGTLNVNCSGTNGLRMGENVATGNGGGLCLIGGTLNLGTGTHYIGKYTYTEGSITKAYSGNLAGAHGGGIYCANGDMTLSGKTLVTGNYAGAVVSATRSITASQSSTGGNGGGIYFDSDGTGDDANTLTLNVTTINNNTAYAGTSDTTTGNGGGIYMASGNLTVIGSGMSHIDNNIAQNNGGGLHMSAGTITLAMEKSNVTNDDKNDLEVHNNKAKNGAGVYFGESGKIIITTTTDKEGRLHAYQNIASVNGGGMHISGCEVDADSELKLGGNNEANNGNGGGLYIGNAAKLTLSYSTAYIYTNSAINGGGIYVDSGTTFIPTKGIALHDNVASSNGGGLYTKVSMTLGNNVTVGHIPGTNRNVPKPNKAVDGAGIYAYGVTLTLSGVSVKYNQASRHGGGIYMNGGSLATGDSNSIGNVTENYAGVPATVDVTKIETADFDYSTITGGNGGGIYIASGATMTMNGGTLENNFAYAEAKSNGEGNGGGIAVAAGGTLIIKGGTIQNNRAYTSNRDYTSTALGGGLYIEGTLKVSGTAKITNNFASRYAGGIYQGGANSAVTIESGASLNVNSNTSDIHGGGYTINAGTLTVNGLLNVNNNVASTGSGGGFCMDGSGQVTGSSTGKTVISGNTAYNNGGGIYVITYGSATTANDRFEPAGVVEITGNKAISGGGVYITGGNGTRRVTLQHKDSKIDGNYAKNGGGAYLAGGTLELKNGATISNHTKQVPDAADTTKPANGGGIYMVGGTVTLDGASEIKGNEVERVGESGGNGGGVYMSAGTLNVLGGSKISGNEASFGGGIYADGTGIATVTNSFVSGNTATGTGGGMFVTGAAVTVNGTSEIQGNQANGGGGVRMTSGSLALANTAKIADNRSTASGGGVHMGGGTLSIANTSSITGNTASDNGGGIWMNGGTLNLNGTTAIHGNTATGNGGGMYYTGGTIALSGTPSIYDNTAKNGGGIFANANLTLNGALTIGHATDSTLGNEATAGTGGGIYAVNNLSLTGVKVSYNTSTNHGGGIYVARNATTPNTVTLGTGTEIAYNKALRDSANKAKHGGGIYTHTCTVTVSDGVNIHHNESTSNGGGMFIYCGSATLGSGVKIQHNTAGDSGGGICIYDEGAGTLPTLSVGANTEISNNQASNYHGGGIYARLTNVTLSEGVNIHHNTSYRTGGGIHLTRVDNAHTYNADTNVATTTKVYPIPTFTATGTQNSPILIQNNQSTISQGGGVYAYSCHVIVDRIDVSNNTSYDMGGGWLLVSYDRPRKTHTESGEIYYLDGNLDLSEMVFSIKNSTISNNNSGKNAGGIYAEGYGKTTIQNCQLSGNKTTGYGGATLLSMKGYAPTISGCTISGNEASTNAGGIWITTVTNGTATLSNNTITGNVAKEKGGGIFLANARATITGGEISGNTAHQFGGGVYLYADSNKTASLTMTGFAKSPIRNNIAGTETNWDSAAGNDIYAIGTRTTVTISANTDTGAPEYWFADYAKDSTAYPGQPTFPSSYKENGVFAHLGRYAAEKTPITFARRYFGAAYETNEVGATAASTALLALTLGEAPAGMNLTLTKALKQNETAVENTTFIFYIKGVDNADFLMPVAINLEKGDKNGTVTINELPLGVYDIYEDESWSWRYDPSTAVYSEDDEATLSHVDSVDGYIRITAKADATHAVTFTNGIENVFWLSDADYHQPFLAPTKAAMKRSSAEDDEDSEETSE